ncbi:ABC transporter permease subunit [Pseudohalocynthiibacter aestuariivivens]|nr:ABC transporter permease subunit [Pseudohalocynthiibacter aestuariivivens]
MAREFGPMVLSGVWVTVLLSLSSLLLATVLGMLGSAAKLAPKRWMRRVGGGYTLLIRGVPDLVLMLLLFFGGEMLLNQVGRSLGLWTYIEIPPFLAGVVSIGIIFGAYMTETFRGAFMAIPKGQIEAALAIGMNQQQILRRIVFPLIIPLAIPSYTNNWLVLLKTTALVSIIGLQDVMYNAHQAGRTSQEPFLFLIMAMGIYLTMTLVSDFGLKLLNRHFSTV